MCFIRASLVGKKSSFSRSSQCLKWNILLLSWHFYWGLIYMQYTVHKKCTIKCLDICTLPWIHHHVQGNAHTHYPKASLCPWHPMFSSPTWIHSFMLSINGVLLPYLCSYFLNMDLETSSRQNYGEILEISLFASHLSGISVHFLMSSILKTIV